MSMIKTIKFEYELPLTWDRIRECLSTSEYNDDDDAYAIYPKTQIINIDVISENVLVESENIFGKNFNCYYDCKKCINKNLIYGRCINNRRVEDLNTESEINTDYYCLNYKIENINNK